MSALLFYVRYGMLSEELTSFSIKLLARNVQKINNMSINLIFF